MIQLGGALSEPHIKSHLFKGDVLIWEDYEFEDGTSKDSRLILLTDCRNGSFLAIRATTQKLELYTSGKVFKEFFIIENGDDPVFERRTIIDIQKIHLLQVEKMKNIFGGKIKRVNISQETLEKINNLVTNSKTMRRDWKTWSIQSEISEHIEDRTV